jgi:polyhydroxyalkanoate synthesis regulator phasin
LETANAFEAPLLANCNSNDTVEELVHKVKDQVVKYGVINGDESGDRKSKLRLRGYKEVYTPSSGTIF